MVVMTEAKLRELCKKHDGFLTPAANDKLYANYCGFRVLGGLERYTELRCLFLEGNGLDSLAGLPLMSHLKCLYLQSNGMYNLEGLESAPGLHTLNIDQNFLETLEGLEVAPELRTLLAAGNNFETIDDLRPLRTCRCLTTVDLRNNNLESAEGLIDLLQALPALRCLYLRGNEFVSNMRNYRKTFIAALPELTYLDDRPIFEVERRASIAWQKGGLDEERAERLRAVQEERAAGRANFETVQGMRRETWRKRRASMGLSPGEADPFFETNKVARSDGGRDDMEVAEGDSDAFLQPCRKCTYEVCRCKPDDDGEALAPLREPLPPQEEARFQEMLKHDPEQQATEEESAKQLAKLLEEDQWGNMRPEMQQKPYSASIKDEELRPASLKRKLSKLQLGAQANEDTANDSPEAPQTPPPQWQQPANAAGAADSATAAASEAPAAPATAAASSSAAADAPDPTAAKPLDKPPAARRVSFAPEPTVVVAPDSVDSDDEPAETDPEPAAHAAAAAVDSAEAEAALTQPAAADTQGSEAEDEMLPKPKAPTGRRLRPATKWQDNDTYEEIQGGNEIEEVEEINTESEDEKTEDVAPPRVDEMSEERAKNLRESQEMLDALGAASSHMRMAWASY